MKISSWLKPGIITRKWIALGSLGMLLIILSVACILSRRYDGPVYILLFAIMLAAGGTIIYISYRRELRSIITLFNSSGSLTTTLDMQRLNGLVYEKRLLIRGPKVVVIGGGTGLSTMLRGLKSYTSNLTAIVTVADDGGGSGMLRESLGMLPPGDIRNCLLALADTEPLMEDLLQYRFKDGMLKGQSFGNLFIAAMNGISDNFEEAIRKMSHVLAVTGEVLPVTLADVKLSAELENGMIIEGESNIPQRDEYMDVPIKRVFINPDDAAPLREALAALDEADAIVLGPGSLYTSIMPNLLVRDIIRRIAVSTALKIYVSNIMTQPGETTGYTAGDHIDAILKCAGRRIIDYVIVNTGKIPEDLRGKYIEDGASEVIVDRERIERMGIRVVERNLVSIHRGAVRHDSDRLAHTIMEIILEQKLSRDKKNSIEYYYLNERLKASKRQG